MLGSICPHASIEEGSRSERGFNARNYGHNTGACAVCDNGAPSASGVEPDSFCRTAGHVERISGLKYTPDDGFDGLKGERLLFGRGDSGQ